MKRLFALALVLVAIGTSAFVRAQAPASKSIEGRWTASYDALVSSFSTDVVLSVDGDHIYGMVGDLQIRGTISDGTFSFEAATDVHHTWSGSLQPDGTISGKASVTVGSPGNALKKLTTWRAKRTVR